MLRGKGRYKGRDTEDTSGRGADGRAEGRGKDRQFRYLQGVFQKAA